MMGATVDLAIVLAGLVMTRLLFYHLPVLPKVGQVAPEYPNVSVIIPARNEALNLPLLLTDLAQQSVPVYEVICVDDASEDATGAVALAHGATVVTLNRKPAEWIGKSWACQRGANVAQGELLLFLDADVRLGREGLQTLMQAYCDAGCTVSVQPYHQTQEVYEQCSMMFNLVQIAANGAALPKQRAIGLYGPVILISKQDYYHIGGHESVKQSLIEDMALGQQLHKAGLPFRLFIGNAAVSFRMYGHGMTSLHQGWVKNIAAGAARTPPWLFFMVLIWLTSLSSVPIGLIRFASTAEWTWLGLYCAIYFIWVYILTVISRPIGHYQNWACVLYPVPLLIFLEVMVVSLCKRLCKLKVVWKGRAITSGER